MAPSPYTTIGLTAKLHLEDKDTILRPIVALLQASGADLYVDQQTIGDLPCTNGLKRMADIQHLSLLIAVGGDGTILRTIRELQPQNIPFIGINAGSVGFLSEMTLAQVPTHLPPLLAGEGFLEQRSCISVEVLQNGTASFQCIALNDIVISQGTISRLVDLQASADGQLLATYHADGLIVATPTGSTAYSLAAGGPVVHPAVEALILTPINPHSFTQKPIVLPGDTAIDVVIATSDGPRFANATVGLTVDGQVYEPLQPGDRIRVQTGMHVQFLRAKEDTFYHALRTKLKWGEGLED